MYNSAAFAFAYSGLGESGSGGNRLAPDVRGGDAAEEVAVTDYG
jgi:hypothetical protein